MRTPPTHRSPARAGRTPTRRVERRLAAGGWVIALLATLTAAPASATEPPDFAAAAQTFATEVAARHRLDPGAVAALLADARFDADIIARMERPYETRPWPAYRQLFVTPTRTAAGVAYWQTHAAALDRAAATYGVDPAIIVAIIGIETRYGASLGEHRALDALATLAFAYPRRADFFRGELEQYVLLAGEEAIDPRTAQGSYAGALGKPQFMPSSYRNHAVDFDGDGRRDLWTSDADVIGSVANYLAAHGWRPGATVALPALLTRGRPAGLNIGDRRPLAPNTTLGQLAGFGVQPAALLVTPMPGDTAVALLGFDGDGADYLLAFDNFHVITRYNHSNLYARAALELGQAIGAARATAQPQDQTGGNHGDNDDTGGAARTPG